MQFTLRAAPLRAAPAITSTSARAGVSRRALTVYARKTAAKGATYVCLDCGWVYDGRKGPFEDLPEGFPNGYRCPVCLAPKRRFKKQEPASKKAAGRKAQRNEDDGKLDEGDKQFFAVAAAGAAVLLAGLYFYLNSQTSL